MRKSAIADLCVRDASLRDAPHHEAEFLPAESFAPRMAHRNAALLITTEYNAGFAPQRAAIAFGCIPRMAHGVSTSRQMKTRPPFSGAPISGLPEIGIKKAQVG